MKLTSKIIVVCCCIALLAACKKSKNNSPTGDKLRAGKWKVSGSTSTFNYMGKDTTIETYSHWRACEQDDLLMFEESDKGTSDENSNKCPEDEQTRHFTWELLENDTKVEIKISGTTFVSDIVEVNDTQLKLRSVENDSPLGQMTQIDSYTNIR